MNKESNLILNDKFCKTYGRVLIMAPEADSKLITSKLHMIVMQTIPILYQSPGRSIDIIKDGASYKITHRGNGIYIIMEIK
jgi:hypothetical protein